MSEFSEIPFEVLLDEYGPMVYLLAYHITGSHHAAEDVYQETFLRVFKYGHSFSQEGNLRGWIYKIALHEAWRWRKKYSREVSLDESLWGQMEEAKRESFAKEIERRLEKAIQKLGEKKKAVFVLRTYHELSLEEIAQILDLSLSHVKVLLFRARQEISKALEEFLE